MRFYLTSCRFVIKPIDTLVLPAYKGVVLRGGLGWVFRDLVCIKKDRVCATCLIARKCSYFRIFETPVPTDARMMRKYPFAPHPFVISPPLSAMRQFDSSAELVFDLTLIGRAIDYLPYFVYVFDELGSRGLGSPANRFSLVRIEDASGAAGNGLVYDGEAKKLNDSFRRLHFSELRDTTQSPLACPTVGLTLLTPTHVVRESGIDHELKFTTVMQSLLRRIKLLQYFHCLDRPDASGSPNGLEAPSTGGDGNGELTSEEVHKLLAISDQINTVEKRVRWVGHPRTSRHSGAPMTLSGFIGEIQYQFPSEEALAAIFPYLRLGEFVHIGKYTSFGFGKIKIDVLARSSGRAVET